MVLPLLFALGGQMLAASAGATVLGSAAVAGGLAAAAGNVVGQSIQNGGVRDIDWGSAALSGVGAGLSAGVPGGAPAPSPGIAGAAKNAALETAKNVPSVAAAAATPAAAATDVAANVATQGGKLASGIASAVPAATPAAGGAPWFDKMINPDNLMKAGGQMVDGYGKNMAAMGAAAMGGMTSPVPKYDKNSGSEADQQELQDRYNEYLTNAINHEANNNAFRYPAGTDVRQYMNSAGVRPYYGPPGGITSVLPTPRTPRSRTSVRGYADGGAVPTGIGLNAMMDDVQKQEQQQFAQEQTQEMFDIAIMIVTNKLNPQEQQKAMQIMVDAMGEQQAMQYLQAVAESVKGSKGKVVAGQPSEQDNVMAQDAQTGEPIKLASGEGILPTSMVQAAGGGLDGMKNIVAAASKNLPEIRQPAMRFMQEAHT
jgi:hypothetical protein